MGHTQSNLSRISTFLPTRLQSSKRPTNSKPIHINMPRSMAPPPSGEFTIRLQKPFSGSPTHTVEVIGEPNRPAVIRSSQHEGTNKTSEKSGDVPKDDVNDQDVVFELNTFEIQWANKDEDPTASDISELAAEQKQTFKDVVDSFEALARTFAKQDSAI